MGEDFLMKIAFVAILGICLFFYGLTHRHAKEPVDVVIPCCQKDAKVLDLCIEGIRKQGRNIRRVIVVSKTPLTDKAEWFDEKLYPFTIADLGKEIFPNDPSKAKWFSSECSRRGWIYQQLLKLYAPLVIPKISSNVLILDADVIFLRPVEFLTESGIGLYGTGTEWHGPYFKHMSRLLPKLRRVFPPHSGVCHHMLFQKRVIRNLFAKIVAYHKKEPWKALCACIDPDEIEGSCLSEYEIYFNYLFSNSGQAKLRPLKWDQTADFSEATLQASLQNGCDYIACHTR